MKSSTYLFVLALIQSIPNLITGQSEVSFDLAASACRWIVSLQDPIDDQSSWDIHQSVDYGIVQSAQNHIGEVFLGFFCDLGDSSDQYTQISTSFSTNLPCDYSAQAEIKFGYISSQDLSVNMTSSITSPGSVSLNEVSWTLLGNDSDFSQLNLADWLYDCDTSLSTYNLVTISTPLTRPPNTRYLVAGVESAGGQDLSVAWSSVILGNPKSTDNGVPPPYVDEDGFPAQDPYSDQQQDSPFLLQVFYVLLAGCILLITAFVVFRLGWYMYYTWYKARTIYGAQPIHGVGEGVRYLRTAMNRHNHADSFEDFEHIGFNNEPEGDDIESGSAQVYRMHEVPLSDD